VSRIKWDVHRLRLPIFGIGAIALVVVIVFAFAVSSALAWGDKVRDDNGQGAVNQMQVQNPPTFQP